MPSNPLTFRQRSVFAANANVFVISAVVLGLALWADGFTRWFLLFILALVLWTRIGGHLRRKTVIEIDGHSMRVTRRGKTKEFVWTEIKKAETKASSVKGFGIDRVLRLRHGLLWHDIVTSEMEDEAGLLNAVEIMWMGTKLEQAGAFDLEAIASPA